MYTSRHTTLLILLLGVMIRIPMLFTPIQEGIRNAQTAALTAGMIENGLLRLDPIAPWRGDLDARLALEFPLYNLTALTIHLLPGIPLDSAGRLASLLFWIFSFIALQALWRRTLSSGAKIWANFLFVLAPMNWYLSTAFMPETLVQFLAVAFMVAALDYARQQSGRALLALFLCGLLGLLVKLPVFAHLGIFMVLIVADRQGVKALVNPLLLTAGAVSVASLYGWGEYIKSVNTPYFADWAGLENVIGFIRPQASRLSPAYYLPLAGYNIAFIITVIGLPFVLWGTWRYIKTFRTSFVSRIWVYLLISLILNWLVWGKGAPSQNYYNLPNLVFACAAFSKGLSSLVCMLEGDNNHSVLGQCLGIGMVLLLLVCGAAGYLYLARPDTVTIRAAAWITANTCPTDLIIYQPRHSPAVMDYQHQPLLSHLSGRRTWIWTRGTPEFEKDRAIATAAYAIITQPPPSHGFMERLRQRFKGTPSALPSPLSTEKSTSTRKIYADSQFSVIALRP